MLPYRYVALLGTGFGTRHCIVGPWSGNSRMWFGEIWYTMKKIGSQMAVGTCWSMVSGLDVVAGRLQVEGEACLAKARRRIWSDAGGGHVTLVYWIRESRTLYEMKTLLTGVSISFKQTVLPVLKERGIPYTSSVT